MGSTDVEVRRSRRRRRTVSAYREDGRTIVLIPARFTKAEEQQWVATMLDKLAKGDKRRRPERRPAAHPLGRAVRSATSAARREPTSIRWVTNQNSRWGSCTPADGTIRISTRVKGMPGFVLDYVILHELAHLLSPGHGPDFWALLAGLPAARAGPRLPRGRRGDGRARPVRRRDRRARRAGPGRARLRPQRLTPRRPASAQQAARAALGTSGARARRPRSRAAGRPTGHQATSSDSSLTANSASSRATPAIPQVEVLAAPPEAEREQRCRSRSHELRVAATRSASPDSSRASRVAAASTDWRPRARSDRRTAATSRPWRAG